MPRVMRSSFLSFLTLLFLPSIALACPTIQDLVDMNCDQQLTVVFIGDSIVYGVGDGEHEEKGGYVLRLAEQLSGANALNFGVPGITSAKLADLFAKIAKGKTHKDWKKALGTADYIVIDVGRNDYFKKVLETDVVKNINITIKNIKGIISKLKAPTPLIAVASLAKSSRPKQQPFINKVNKAIRAARKKGLILGPEFDEVDGLKLNRDGLHPTSAGYAQLEFAVESFLRIDAQAKAVKINIDSDGDGLYDRFEASRFGTDPTKYDTDGDGIGDGDEIFILNSDPLTPNDSINFAN